MFTWYAFSRRGYSKSRLDPSASPPPSLSNHVLESDASDACWESEPKLKKKKTRKEKRKKVCVVVRVVVVGTGGGKGVIVTDR